MTIPEDSPASGRAGELETPSTAWRAAAVAVCGASLAWTMLVGRWGHFAVDQSMVIDGAYRMVEGQVPYRDFLVPHGLLTITYQWVLFELLGVGYGVFVLGGAILDAFGAAMAILTVRRLLPAHPWLAMVAGALTGLWFAAPFGTPWSDQISFSLSFVALNLVLLSLRTGPLARFRAPALLLAGVLLSFSFLGKQTAAALFLPVPVAIVVFGRPRGPRRELAATLGSLLSGLAAGTLAFAVWLVTYAEPAQFLYATVTVPSGALVPRLLGFAPYVLATRRGEPALVFLLFLLMATGAVLHLGLRARPGDGARRLAAVTCLALVLFQNLVALITLNQSETLRPFLGVNVAISFALVPEALAALGERLRVPALRSPRWRLLVAAIALLVAAFGIRAGWSRCTHDVFDGSTFDGHLEAGGWESLIWARPTPIEGVDYRAEDVNGLVRYLRDAEENFFVFPDHTLLYAMAGRPPSQPVLFFWRGISYPAGGDPRLDATVVSALERSDVNVVVLEEPFFAGEACRSLDDFPALAAFIQDRFRPRTRFGPFNVLVREGDAR